MKYLWLLVPVFLAVIFFFKYSKKKPLNRKAREAKVKELNKILDEVKMEFSKNWSNRITKDAQLGELRYQINQILKLINTEDLFDSDIIDIADVFVLHKNGGVGNSTVQDCIDVLYSLDDRFRHEDSRWKIKLRSLFTRRIARWLSDNLPVTERLHNDVVYQIVMALQEHSLELFPALDAYAAEDKEWRAYILQQLHDRCIPFGYYETWVWEMIKNDKALLPLFIQYVFRVDLESEEWRVKQLWRVFNANLVEESGLVDAKYITHCIKHNQLVLARKLIEHGAQLSAQWYDSDSLYILQVADLLVDKEIAPTKEQFERIFELFAAHPKYENDSQESPWVYSMACKIMLNNLIGMLHLLEKGSITEKSFESLAKCWKRDNVAKFSVTSPVFIVYCKLYDALHARYEMSEIIMQIFARHGCEDLVNCLAEEGVVVTNDVILAATWYAAEQRARKK